MLAQEIAETTGIKQCHACGAELLERDKFCRRCGVGQGVPTSTLTGVTDGSGFCAIRVDFDLLSSYQQSSPSRTSSLKSTQDYRAGFIRKIK